MEHTNLFLFENQSAFEAEYPNDRVDSPIPGVAYVRASGSDEAATYYNRMVTAYTVTIHSLNKSGETVAEDYTIQSPNVLDGNTVKMNVVGEEVEGYKPKYATEKIEVSGSGVEHTVLYLAATSYTVTVHHMCDGENIADDTEIVVEDIFEEDTVKVKIEPVNISGYEADPAYITISGDAEYTLEYEATCQAYEFVDLGLPSGTLWATTNLGASDEYDEGSLYAWGEIVGDKDEYEWSNYKWCDGTPKGITKYGEIDDKWELELDDDAAFITCCGGAHVPTMDQWYELEQNTTIEAWEENGNTLGLILYSKSNDNYIKIPNGWVGGDSSVLEDHPMFWLQDLDDTDIAYAVCACCEGSLEPYAIARKSGVSIRPVIGESPVPGPTEPVAN